LSDTTFINGTVIEPAWLNDVNDAVYTTVPANTSAITAITTNLADTVGSSNGTAMLGWLRALTSSVATTLKSWLGWQEISAFEFMTTAQIADYKSGAKTLDLATPLQAWINALAASASSGGQLIGRLPPGGGRVGTTLTLPTGVVIRGHGIKSQLSGWGVSVFQITGDHIVIEDLTLFGYTNAGVADPKAQDAISSNGTLGTKRNYARLKRLYLQGWNRCIDFQYMDGSVVDDITTVNCNYSIRYYGQSVNNTVSNSRLQANTGTASIVTTKNGADQGEGLMVTNCLLASGVNAFNSDGFLAVSFYNCIADLHTGNAFECSGVGNFVFEGPWVYSSGGKCFNFAAQGSSFALDAKVSVGLATATGAGQSILVMGANNVGLSLPGGTYYLSNATGSVPFVFDGSNVSVGAVIVRNSTTNSDIKVNGATQRISQEAILPNGIQFAVSQIRSVASGATTTLPVPTGAAIENITITGNTGCTSLNDPVAWAGRMVALKFTGTPTWTDGGNLKLNGNFVSTADDMLTLVSDGTSWYEMARSAN
jgi:hypothetical protein